MRADGSCRVSISTQWRLSLKFPFLPDQLVICIQHNEVINVSWWNEILFTSSTWVCTPSSKKYYVRSTYVRCMSISWHWRTSWYTNSSPFIFLCIQNSYIVQVTGLQLSSLSKTCLLLSVLVKVKTSLNYHVCSYLDSCVALARRRQWTLTFWLAPCHHLQIKHIQVVKVFFTICSTKDEDLSLSHQNSRMTISRWWRTNTLGTLKPCHRNRIKSMQVSEYFSLGTSSSKDDNLGSSKNSRVSISRRRRSSGDFRFSELVSVDVKNVGVIEISVAFCFSSEIMSTKDNDWCSWQCGWVSTSRTWTYTLDNGISPLPSSNLEFSIGLLAGWLVGVWVFTLLFAFLALRMAMLVTFLGMLRLLHLFHVGAFLLFFLILVGMISLVWSIFLREIGLIIAFHEWF